MKDYKTLKEPFSEAFCCEVYGIVKQIPVGKVASYGFIAKMLGKPQCSRMVGKALKHAPDGLPCHRVVNGQGGLVPGWKAQRELLNSEKVCFKSRGNVDMSLSRWQIDSL